MSTSRFDYLIDKVASATFVETPFRHLRIDDLFEPEDLAEILACQEIAIPPAQDDDDLFRNLLDAGYKIIDFPGCTIDKAAYLAWRRTGRGQDHHTACEGFGITVRLKAPKTALLAELDAFLTGRAFNEALAAKYGIELDGCNIDGGIQKYLDGYEISPHPDIRRKALTYMVNINPHTDSERLDHHTHYLRLRPERAYVQSFWEGNPEAERCWVPWEWCTTEALQTENNSMVIFSPNSDTLHGVKASYDHLTGQRTQLYGNLWYRDQPELQPVEWEDLDIRSVALEHALRRPKTVRQRLKALVPHAMRPALKRLIKPEGDEVERRTF